MGEYGGRISKKAARVAVAFRVNSYGVSHVTEKDVELISTNEAKELVEKSKRGGFQVFISIENVPAEKTIYVKGLYLLLFGNIPRKKSAALDVIRTSGEEKELDVKKLVAKYLNDKYDYWVEPEEVHFLKEKDRERFEVLTA